MLCLSTAVIMGFIAVFIVLIGLLVFLIVRQNQLHKAAEKQLLTSCKVCQKQIAVKAEICPHCGKRLKMPPVMGCLIFLLILGVIGGAVIFAVNFTMPANVTSKPAGVGRLFWDESIAIYNMLDRKISYNTGTNSEESQFILDYIGRYGINNLTPDELTIYSCVLDIIMTHQDQQEGDTNVIHSQKFEEAKSKLKDIFGK
ncbi:EGFR-like transmembrane domain-containing protein [Brevibacillus laterosporus]|uniref:EGFR-like transmembrane domain-containing protein n=1 Tax=Brevibacillus laterosporus TaxID=1465 RepID=UPI00264B236B|nr:zinc ribbon domain-containing protein [Brevibacillus laterosporus]MDN9011871.1 zinc ribbon domain-containing protein [Brevibacillus laterosporus]MDO0942967.1 zinc ribbon domain-containing protein [Brevibacillus laterosporus]